MITLVCLCMIAHTWGPDRVRRPRRSDATPPPGEGEGYKCFASLCGSQGAQGQGPSGPDAAVWEGARGGFGGPPVREGRRSVEYRF